MRKFGIGDKLALTEETVRQQRGGKFWDGTAYKYPPRTILTVIEYSHDYNSDVLVTPQEGLESVYWNECWLETYRGD